MTRARTYIGLIWLFGCLAAAGYCFTRPTDATTTAPPKQITKAIEDIKVGDWVMAKDPDDSGPPTPHRVIGLPRNWTEHVVHIEVRGGAELQSTRAHPFWNDERGWTNASDLHPGDHLLDDKGGRVVVDGVRVEDRTCDTYNLTVEGVHTFYVVAGEIPVLVHNSGPYGNIPDPPSVGPGKNFTQAQKQAILDANRQANGGVLRSDISGQELVPSQKSQSGVTPPSNEAQIDHMTPRNPADPSVAPGTNSNSNAQVASRAENRAKSNACP
jgi:hypothetical protein